MTTTQFQLSIITGFNEGRTIQRQPLVVGMPAAKDDDGNTVIEPVITTETLRIETHANHAFNFEDYAYEFGKPEFWRLEGCNDLFESRDAAIKKRDSKPTMPGQAPATIRRLVEAD